MDIVQYLHGLVSHPLGFSNEDASADLLKQYYALSVVHIVEHDIDIKDKKNHSILNVWEKQTLPLTKRLARSFHMDEMQTLTLLRTVTPLMMTELNGVAGSLKLSEFVAQNFHRSRTHLPSWASQFVRGDFINLDEVTHHDEASQEEGANTVLTDDVSIAPNVSTDSSPTPSTVPPKPPKARNKTTLMVGGAILSLAVIGTGVWYALNSSTKPVADPNVSTLDVKPLDIPRLSITSGENRDLYACQAEVGSDSLHRELMQILQQNFEQASCIIDIDNQFGSSLVGLERLESIIAMLKSEPFSSIEIVGDEIFVNTPNTQVLNRLVNDITLLAPQFKVSAVPPLDVPTLTNQSLAKASNALNTLEAPSAYNLARAMSLQVLDFNGTDQIPPQNQEVLMLSAKKLAQNPDIKLLIISHTDSNGMDRATNLALSQNQAEAVRNFLIQHGASETQLVAKGVADAFPISDNITTVGKFKNRRTEFLVYDEAILASLSVDTTEPITTTMPYGEIGNMGVANGASEAPMNTMPNIPMNPPVSAPSAYAQPQPMPTQNNNVINPMPVQGMPNAQTYMPPREETYYMAQPYQGEVNPNSHGGIIVIEGAETSIANTPPSPTINVPSPISDEVMELSKPVHVEIGRGVSHEIRE